MTKCSDLFACDNTQCPSHTQCRRWKQWHDCDYLNVGVFAPSGKHSQKCRFFKKI